MSVRLYNNVFQSLLIALVAMIAASPQSNAQSGNLQVAAVCGSFLGINV